MQNYNQVLPGGLNQKLVYSDDKFFYIMIEKPVSSFLNYPLIQQYTNLQPYIRKNEDTIINIGEVSDSLVLNSEDFVYKEYNYL